VSRSGASGQLAFLDEADDAGSLAEQLLGRAIRIAEAILFASSEPVADKTLLERLPNDVALDAVMKQLTTLYANRGVNVVRVGGAWCFRTAPDLGFLLRDEAPQQKKLSRAALEVLATIAYHQPVTRAEIEDVRGVETSKGTLDLLLESGWVRMRGRRRTPGRPVTYGTSAAFLDHFGLSELRDLPGLEEIKGAGLLSPGMPSNFTVPLPPAETDLLGPDEDELTNIDLEELGLLTPRVTED
jgi:segregation and condensation protein B